MSCYPPLSGVSVRANMATSLDGRTTLEGRSAGLSSPTDRTIFHHLRATSQIILVGLQTALAESYGKPKAANKELARWRASAGLPPSPRLIIATSHPESYHFDAADGAVALRPHLNNDELAELVGLDRDLPGGVLCEGGPHFLVRLAEMNLVDEYCLAITPKLVGAGNLSLFPSELSHPLALGAESILVHQDGLFLRLRPQERPHLVDGP
jgi:riboflavin biosynthesis pyrimidine reductase